MTWLISIGLSLAVSIYGTVRLFRSKEALYFKMILCANWCYTAQLIYQLCLFYCVSQDMPLGDNALSGLGTNAFAAFVFSANFGPFDQSMDGKPERHNKARVFALAAPILFLALTAGLFVVWSDLGHPVADLAIYMVISAAMFPLCSYYNLKYLIIRADDEFTRGVKPVNLFSLLFCFGFLGEMYFSILGNELWLDIFSYADMIFSAAMVFAAVWGSKKWRS